MTRTQGFTLIEMMVALTLGLVISLGVTTVLITSNRSSSVTDTVTEAHESGRYAINHLHRAIIQAGYDPGGVGYQPFASLCDPAVAAADCAIESDNGTGDRIAFSRLAEAGNSVSCTGSDLGHGTDQVVTDVYWVQVINNVSSLYCQTYVAADGNPTNSQALVAGIEAIHALYGVSLCNTPSGERNVSLYLNAADIEAPPAAIFATTCPDGSLKAVDWSRVYSVKLALLARGAEAALGESLEQTYILQDAAPYDFTGENADQFIRQVYSTTATRSNY